MKRNKEMENLKIQIRGFPVKSSCNNTIYNTLRKFSKLDLFFWTKLTYNTLSTVGTVLEKN